MLQEDNRKQTAYSMTLQKKNLGAEQCTVVNMAIFLGPISEFKFLNLICLLCTMVNTKKDLWRIGWGMCV